MHTPITPAVIKAHEVPTCVGWYMVWFVFPHVTISSLVQCDGIEAWADYEDMMLVEREGYARQAIELALCDVNTHIVEPKGYSIVPQGWE